MTTAAPIASAIAESRGEIVDEEALPYAPDSFDRVVSALALQYVTDLPGALAQIRRALKPDGLFFSACFAGETLAELRNAWLFAESETPQGVSPRIAPMIGVREMGGLLQRAGRQATDRQAFLRGAAIAAATILPCPATS